MITWNEEKQIFHLHNSHLSCVLAVQKDEAGREELLMPYLGSPLHDAAACLYRTEARWYASFDSPRSSLPYALPTAYRGDHRPAMLCAKEASGQKCTELFYTGYRMEAGKPKLCGLPATYVEDAAEADTLYVTLQDPLTGLEAELCYTLYASRPVLTCSVKYTNKGTAPLSLIQAGSLCLNLPDRWDMIHLQGAHCRERKVERVKPARLVRSVSSDRGASGHDHNPFVALAAESTTEDFGECVGVNLVYSGDFDISVYENAFGTTRLVAGLNPATLEWQLNPGDSFQTPEAVTVWSSKGLNAMSQAFHELYRRRLCRGYWRDKERPILINNWEATYFKFNHDKLMAIARTAADVGIELFVLDDGWFGKRDSDNCSLGDWVVNTQKLEGGLTRLAADISALGLKFGLWFEPEMISPDSDLYRAHPDWCLHVNGRNRSECRQQLILDMSRQDVQDYVIESVSSVLRSADISYVKWDMNRNFMEAGSDLLLDGREGELSYRYMLGVYRTMEAVTTAFPQVLFESCSGGGGRFDAGILYYMPQTWTSDDSDAIERLQIQYGTSYCYPTSAMGAHVSAVPNHQAGRITPMRTRGDVAMSGNFGYELDLSVQTPENLEEIRRQVAQMKQLRKTTAQGVFTRLLSPFEGNMTAWQFVDEERLILFVARTLNHPNAFPFSIRLKNVPEGSYVAESGEVYDAADLMNAGLRVKFDRGDYQTRLIVLERK